MRFFRRGGPDSSGTAPAGDISETCEHVLLVPHWDSPENMGIDDKASSYRCNTCDESFTREEEEILRRTETDRIRRGLQERRNIQARYPVSWNLADGREVELDRLASSNRNAFLQFARSLPHDDLLFMREDLSSSAVVDGLVKNVADGIDFALVAQSPRNHEVVGYASLHGEPMRWTRNVGEVRVIVAGDYRGSGLGGRLVRDAIDAAPNFGSRKITAQMTVDQEGARGAFERLGFKEEATLTGWVTDRRGLPRDLLIMALDLSVLDED